MLGWILATTMRSGLTRLGDGSAGVQVRRDAQCFVKTASRLLRGRRVLWAHGASVGEAKCLYPIIDSLVESGACDAVAFSYTSPDGLIAITTRASALSVLAITCPLLDVRAKEIRNALRDAHLVGCVVAEGDLWPRLVKVAHERAAPVILVDARFKQARNTIGRFVRWVQYSFYGRHCNAICVPTKEDETVALRYVPRSKVFLTGPSKAIEAVDRAANKEGIREHWLGLLALESKWPILVAGNMASTEAELTAEIVCSFLAKYPSGAAIVAPRHVRRKKVVSQFKRSLRARGLVFSRLASEGAETELVDGSPRRLVLVEAMGLLADLYAIADVAVVGGTFQEVSGHNILEPIALGVPVIAGHGFRNWRGLAASFVETGALVQVDPVGVEAAIDGCLTGRQEAQAGTGGNGPSLAALSEMAQAASRNASIVNDLVLAGQGSL